MLQNQAWGYDEKRDLPNIEATWTKLNAMGLGFYDSAEVYGSGLSEKIIGQQMARTSEEEKKSVIIATKWLPVPIVGSGGRGHNRQADLDLAAIAAWTHIPAQRRCRVSQGVLGANGPRAV